MITANISPIIWYVISIVFIFIYSIYASYRASLLRSQLYLLIISSILFPIMFWLLLGKLTKNHMLFERISIGTFLYINWYYWTYAITNYCNSIHNIINYNL